MYMGKKKEEITAWPKFFPMMYKHNVSITA